MSGRSSLAPRLPIRHPDHMPTVDGPPGSISDQPDPDQPVMVDEWAEAVIDLAPWQSRRRHPSNREPTWEKDGGYETEWVL
jgi:hypothetical protein